MATFGQDLTDEYEVVTKMTKFYKSLTTSGDMIVSHMHAQLV